MHEKPSEFLPVGLQGSVNRSGANSVHGCEETREENAHLGIMLIRERGRFIGFGVELAMFA